MKYNKENIDRIVNEYSESTININDNIEKISNDLLIEVNTGLITEKEYAIKLFKMVNKLYVNFGNKAIKKIRKLEE